MAHTKAPRLARVVWWLMRKAGWEKPQFRSSAMNQLASAAQREAYLRGSTWVAPLHVLLACDPGADRQLAEALARRGISIDRLTRRMAAETNGASIDVAPVQHDAPARWTHLPFLNWAARLIRSAGARAAARGRLIRALDLFLASFTIRCEPLTSMLADSGITPDLLIGLASEIEDADRAG